MPKFPTCRKAGTPPAALKKAIAWLRYHPLNIDFLGLSIISVLLIWGAFK